MSNKDLVVAGSAVGGALSAVEVKQQVQLIQQVMKAVMIPNEHYGKIEGTKKETLFKSGAEKLLLTFRLSARYEEISVEENKEFIGYRIRCLLTHQTTGFNMGEGLGACNSQEKKYRTVSVKENKATPEEKAIGKLEEREGSYGKYNVYVIPANPYDVQNTIYKMACKRALVAAVLNVTAASDLFTQDLDDADFIPEEDQKKEIIQPTEKKSSEAGSSDPSKPTGSLVAGIKTDFSDKEIQTKLKGIGFKWHATNKIWYKTVTKEEFTKLSETYPNIEVIG